MRNVKRNFLRGLAVIFDNLSNKIKRKINFHNDIIIPYIVIVEYNNFAKKLCVKGEDFLLVKHFKNKTFSDIRMDRYDYVESFNRAAIEYYEKEGIPVWFKDFPNHYPRRCHKPTHFEMTPQLF